MAGHSKWANIKHRKGAQDAKRNKLFTKLGREITVAAKEGGPDPEMNPRLRLAIQNAKGSNMPKDTIERAIKKTQGSDDIIFEELTYEGYSKGGIAIYVECSTDNTRRTVQNVKSYFAKLEGSLAKNGSLEFLFDRKGVFNFELPEGMDEEELELELIDAGADDIEVHEQQVQVTSVMEDFGAVNKKLEELNIEVTSANLQRIPHTTKEVDDEVLEVVMKLIDRLEDDDDVQQVFHDLELTDAQAEKMLG
ncbi:YebC/PmpR family DNA-binding transcriptional regulator [Flammeovirga agarivorans]|uniref:Probable transcriptional regulatory protein HGP29_14160 n=1 Tax=Flammeovirga agarivorans TaxID=2726742 RepID=A0A7X8XWJ0_9BACT|nr:YebC/PmpR family DNA-binding transcriptional regulator [Flammeovirga agarivorans]NLR92357.1 YebC/PmpR family DNA-binding transcriptional regulator [Flammeovirga agarivorans]